MAWLCTVVISSEVVKARNDTENSAMFSRHPCNVHLLLYNPNKKSTKKERKQKSTSYKCPQALFLLVMKRHAEARKENTVANRRPTCRCASRY